MNRFLKLVNLSLLLCCGVFATAQTPVSLAPVPQLQFFDANGKVLAFGCVFTYQTGSNTQLATFTDFTGTITNSNPVILTQSGSANMWLQSGQSYRFIVRSAGGTNCSLGTTIESVDGIGGGGSQVTINVPFSPTPTFTDSSQNTLFTILLTGSASAQPLTATGIIPPGFVTWEITQDTAGGHGWSWPANTVGGATVCQTANCTTQQMFEWNGVNAYAVGPATYSTPAFAVPTLFDTFLSPSTVVCADANKQFVSCSAGGAGGVTYNGQFVAFGTTGNVNNGAATHSIALNEGGGNAITGLALTTDQVPVGNASADPTASTLPNCTDSGGQHLNYATGGTFSCGLKGSAGTPQIATLGSPLALTANTQATVVSETVNLPAGSATYRLLIKYIVWITAGPNACTAEAIDNTNSRAFAASGQNSNGTGYIGLTATELSSQTYAGGSSAVFHLDVECNNGAGGLGNATVNMNAGALFTMSPAQATSISVTPVLAF